MIDRGARLLLRRKFRRSRRQVEDMGETAEEHVERHVIRRLVRLFDVRRFVLSWFLLLALLISGVILQTRSLNSYYLNSAPAPGGTYSEGIIGVFTNANPLYATGAVDNAVSRLVFSGLLKYNVRNQLVGDLADSWTADTTELRYTVHLRPNLKWHDGQPLTAEDVAFTYGVIQNPDAKSPLGPSWRGIKITVLDPRTIQFDLPNTFSAFPHSLTNGIVPKHLLDGVEMERLRSIAFNTTQPVGSGPFRWQTIESGGATLETREERIGLTAFDDYHLGKPRIDRLIIRTFRAENQLINSFAKGEVQAMAGLNSLPDELKQSNDVLEIDLSLTSAVMVFFKTSAAVLQDVNVRRALVLAADPAELISELGYPVAVINQPILHGQIGYAKDLAQGTRNAAEAEKLLDAAGWLKDPTTGIRQKDGKPLSFQLISQNTSEYVVATRALQKQWRTIGITVEVDLQPDQDVQRVISDHSYDALLYGITIGADPDVFAYWHSSQADPRAVARLNFSEYKSAVADQALEAGRTRSDPALRSVKYRPFLEAWKTDAPALALYQPRFLYIVRKPFTGFEATTVNRAADRFNGVHQWMIREEEALK